MLQLSCEWAAADFANGRGHREAPSGWTGRAEGCRAEKISKAARSIKEVKALVVDAYMTGRTNAYAENVNKKIKDVKRRSCGFTKCENMRRCLLLAFGYPPLEKGGVPLPNYNG